MAKKKTKTPHSVLEQRRKHYIAHRKERLRYAREYYEKNKETIIKKSAKKAASDPDYAAKKKEYQKKYYRKNKARLKKARLLAKKISKEKSVNGYHVWDKYGIDNE